ncbi:MAG: fibronectin type III domain-containing protein, partial [Candidatus Marinimicrobia bacterium]|nr:fibronectin type III domain-containing protein [Candidatus Neomarinimicrobiota bacterium]
MKNNVLKILLLIAGLTTACTKFDHTNPFDANCDIDWTPKNLQVEVINNSNIKLTWEQHIEQISGFRISRKTNNNEFTQIAEVKLKNIGNIKLNETEFIDTNLIVGNFYIYQIKAWADQFETDNLSSIEIHFDFDCNGIYQGDATVDECGVCIGGNSDQDCAGVCFGDSALDDCGVCDGGNADQDCAGVCFGDSSLDDCGVCDGGNADQDCAG